MLQQSSISIVRAPPVDKTKYFPVYWNKVLADRDKTWLAEAMFDMHGNLKINELSCWLYPPQQGISTEKPQVDRYYYQKVFVWFPRKMWQIPLKCVKCKNRLTSKGLYNRLREVIDIDCRYYLLTEYLECSKCRPTVTYMGWAADLLAQLDVGHRLLFLLC